MVAVDGTALPAPLAAAAQRLHDRLTACARTAPALAVAYSGGVDSRFLCLALQREGIPFLALHAGGPHVPEAESRTAIRRAEARGLRLEIVPFSPLALPEVAAGSRERCYACKAGLVAALRERLLRLGLPDALLCDGSNADDLHAYRPGLRALREAGVASPLAEAGIAKADLRRLGALWGLDDPGQAARPCLLTRLAYGCRPEEDTLRRLADAEAALAALTAADGSPALGELRLRLCPRPLLQHQRPLSSARDSVESILRATGFWPCDFRQTTSVSGFFD